MGVTLKIRHFVSNNRQAEKRKRGVTLLKKKKYLIRFALSFIYTQSVGSISKKKIFFNKSIETRSKYLLNVFLTLFLVRRRLKIFLFLSLLYIQYHLQYTGFMIQYLKPKHVITGICHVFLHENSVKVNNSLYRFVQRFLLYF